jgi:hypothetical protein
MIEVEAPDGSIIEFDEGTSPDVMRAALRKYRAPAKEAAPSNPLGLTKALENANQRVKETEGIGGVLRALPEAIGGTALNAAQGATLGFADEAMAGLAALPKAASERKSMGQAYGEALQGIRGFEKDVYETSPGAATVSQIGGGLLTAGAGAAGNIGRGVQALKASGAGPIRQAFSAIGRGAASGAGIGALEGFGSEEGGLGNRAMGAGIGGAVGGLTGAALPAGAALGKGAVTAAGNIASGALSPGRRAMGLAREVLDNAGLNSPEAVAARLEELGPTATLADLGKRGQRLARTLLDMLGKGGEQIGDVLEKRAADRADRLVTEAGSALNPQGKSFYGTIDEIARTQEQKAAPKYQEAFANARPVDITDVLGGIDKELPTSKGGIRTALERAKGLLQTQDGSFDTSLEGLHQSKMALDDAIQSATKDSSLGNVARAKLKEVRGNLLKAMDASNPTYGEARSIWAGQAAAEDALEQGRAFTKLDPEEIRKTLSGMDETSREAFKTGVMRALEDGKEALPASLKKSKNANQLRAIFGDDQAFEKFTRRAEGERIQAKTEGGMGGSRTASSLSDIDDFQQKTGILSSLLRGDLMGAGAQALGKGGALASGLSERVGNELAPLLMSRDPRVMAEVLKRSTAGQAAGRKSAVAGVSLGQALAGYNASDYK